MNAHHIYSLRHKVAILASKREGKELMNSPVVELYPLVRTLVKIRAD